MEDLKPCPFCGSKAILRKVATGRNRSGYEYYVRCGNIHCPVYVNTCNRDTEDEAVEIWNRRADL